MRSRARMNADARARASQVVEQRRRAFHAYLAHAVNAYCADCIENDGHVALLTYARRAPARPHMSEST